MLTLDYRGVYMSESNENVNEDAEERRNADERRGGGSGSDRRVGWDRRRGPGRRRDEVRRSAEEGELDAAQFEFVMAIDDYKKINQKPFPSYTEILEIAMSLGYRKVAEPQALNEMFKESAEETEEDLS